MINLLKAAVVYWRRLIKEIFNTHWKTNPYFTLCMCHLCNFYLYLPSNDIIQKSHWRHTLSVACVCVFFFIGLCQLKFRYHIKRNTIFRLTFYFIISKIKFLFVNFLRIFILSYKTPKDPLIADIKTLEIWLKFIEFCNASKESIK